MHPIKDREKLREEVLDADHYDTTEHFTEDVVPQQPNVDLEKVVRYLEEHWDDLEAFVYKPDSYDAERYSLVFYQSSKYYFIIGISLVKNQVNIISAYPCGQYRGDPKELAKKFG